MIITYKECFKDYQNYQFGYSVVGFRKPSDTLEDIHGNGYLPYSANMDALQEPYYMARSMRVYLPDRTETSEERRVLKKHTGKTYDVEELEISSLVDNDDINLFFKNYFLLHGGNVMSDERIKYISTWSEGYVRTYRHNGILIGMVVERRSETVGHYWYVAYDLDLRTESIGMWLLIDSVNRAQENGLTYYYLGTGYNKKSLYKINNPSGMSFWDGIGWNTDIKLLKEKMNSD